MRNLVLAASLLLSAAGAVAASPSVQIRDAAARVTVIPEARADVSVVVIKTNPKLPIWISKVGEKVAIHGDVGHMVTSCNSGWTGKPSVGRVDARGASPMTTSRDC